MKKNRFIWIFMLLCAALALSAAAADTCDVRTVPAPSGSYATFADIPVTVQDNELFCGWFTTERAAALLDLSGVAETPSAAQFGAVLQLSESAVRPVSAELYVKSPYGVRFVAEVDKALLRTLEKLNVKNRAGKSGSITPRGEYAKGIGYGTVLALDVSTTAPLEKQDGRNVRGGVTVPGAYTCGETDTALRFSATVLKVTTAQIADRIAVRPYLTYADANGLEHTCYYTEAGKANGAFAISLYDLVLAVEADADATEAEKTAAAAVRKSYTDTTVKVTKITALNTDTAADSADFANAYIETDYTTETFLSAENGANYRYTKTSNYSRIIKVKDNLYLMFFQYTKNGIHLYYATSTDGIHWSETPSVLYNANAAANQYTYTSGTLAGTTDSFYAVNADAVLLKDGSVMVVYVRRLCTGYGYPEYQHLNTIEMLRFTFGTGNKITRSKTTTIYRGSAWEPEILQRKNGQIEVYWSHAAPMLDIYGFFKDDYVWDGETVQKGGKRSSGIGMVASSDNGKTWTPSLATMSANHYAAKRIYQQFACTMPIGDGVNFYSGQMPAVVELSDGRLLLAVEFEPGIQDGMEISLAFSDTSGEWQELGIDEAGPAARYESLFKGAGPSLCRFPSGEVLLSYNSAFKMYTRLLKKDARDATTMADTYELDVFGTDTSKTRGYWSTVAVKDSHTAFLSMAFPRYENYGDGDVNTEEDNSAIGIIFGRLNHTVAAIRKNVVADGNPQEWSAQKEALFVGSESAAQASYRFAYDDEKIYVCIDYLNVSRADGDSLFVSFEKADGSTVTARISGAGQVTAAAGISGGAVLCADGGVYELALDRAALGLTGGSVRVRPGFTAAGVTDVIDGTTTKPATWLTVKLESTVAVPDSSMDSRLFTITELNEKKPADGADYDTVTVHAPLAALPVNGNVGAWDAAGATDALFVSSLSTAQMALRVAHDETYVYFLASVLDEKLEMNKDGDSIILCIADSDTGWYRLTVMLNGKCSMRRATVSVSDGSIKSETVDFGAFASVQTFGTVDDSSDTDAGYLVTVAIPKAKLGLAGATSFGLRPALVDYADGKKTDATLAGGSVSTKNAAHWPRVTLN